MIVKVVSNKEYRTTKNIGPIFSRLSLVQLLIGILYLVIYVLHSDDHVWYFITMIAVTLFLGLFGIVAGFRKKKPMRPAFRQ